jgi:predicted amidohydrolase YtcJ
MFAKRSSLQTNLLILFLVMSLSVVDFHGFIPGSVEGITDQVSGQYNVESSRLTDGPDIILYNAKVLTFDDALPNAEAIALTGNLISAVGSDEEILALQTSYTELYDLEQRTVLPGLIDSHSHRISNAMYNDGETGIIRATEMIAAEGYTTSHELYADPDFISVLQRLSEEGKLAVRVNCYIPYNNADGSDVENWQTYPYTEKKDTTLRIAGVKIFSDGGSVNYPALTTLYLTGDAVGTNGTLYKTEEEMSDVVSEILGAGYPIAMHAYGDSAVGVGLNAFENAFEDKGNALRCRMEHLVFMREELAEKMAFLEVSACIQYSWARRLWPLTYYEDRYEAEAIEWLYAWRRMADLGVNLGGGNDYPYCSQSHAMEAISLVATRQAQRDDLIPEFMIGDELTVEEGIRAMTVNNAWMAMEEEFKGTITPGKLADLTVVSADPLSVEPFDVREIEIEMTVMDGIIRYYQPGIMHKAVHNAGTFAVGIHDQGLWGKYRADTGLVYEGTEYLDFGTVLMSYDENTVALGIRDQLDFESSDETGVQFREPGEIADEEAVVIYEDAAGQHPGSIQVTQESYMWNDEPFLLIKYIFKNIGQEDLNDIYFGQLMDFDIWGGGRNLGYRDENNGLGFLYLTDWNDPPYRYMGLALFDDSGNDASTSAVFTNYNIMRYIYSWDEPDISALMRTDIHQESTEGEGDFAPMLSSGPYRLEVNESISPFFIAVVAGDNIETLRSGVQAAYTYSQDLGNATYKYERELIPLFSTRSYPNPFNSDITIGFQLSDAVNVRIVIYNTSGQRIRNLLEKDLPAGHHTVKWDATDNRGKPVASGIYFFRIQAGNSVGQNKVVLVKSN